MGMFSRKKQTFVSSVIYNLAGDEADRASYLKSAVFGAVMHQETSGKTVGQSINNSYITGPGITFKNWYRYVQNNQPLIKMPSANIGASASVDAADIIPELTVPAGKSAWVQVAMKDDADYMWWAQQFMLRNYPELYNSEWTADFESATKTVNLLMADGSTHQFVAANFNINSDYVYALYTFTANDVVGPVVEGELQTPLAAKPDTTGYTLATNINSPTSISLRVETTTTKSYGNGDPTQTNTVITFEDGVGTDIIEVWKKTEYLGQQAGSDSLVTRATTLNLWRKYNIGHTTTTNRVVTTETIRGEEVDVTTVTDVVKEAIEYYWESRTDTQDTESLTLSNSDIFIYKIGSGGALDKYASVKPDFGGFFPCLPIRIDNKSIRNYGPLNSELKHSYYEAVSKSYKKLLGSDFKELVKNVENNDSIDDIDYAVVNFGAALNSKSNASKRYIYSFFQEMISYQNSSQSDYLAWRLRAQQQVALQTKWNEWKAAQSDSTNPLYGTPQPATGNITKPNSSSIRIQSSDWMSFYNIVISWNYVVESVHTGTAFAGAKTGELKFILTEGDPMLVQLYLANVGQITDADSLTDDTLTILFQVTETEYRRLDISGAYHKNVVYDGKSIGTSARDAMKDSDESGFIVPMHYGIFNKTPLVARTQLTSECAYITFNCYQVVKQKWYQTTLFKIVLVIVIIVIAIFTGGFGAAGAGVLGTNAAVGAAVGLTATAAIVAGVALNALAAMAISAVLMRVATEVLGDKIGPIVGMIASMVAMNVATSYSTTGSMAMGWGDMMNATNLVNATKAVQSTYSAYASDKLQDLQSQATDLQNQYNEKSEEIEAMSRELLGENAAFIDPLTEFTQAGNFSQESAASFLERTLMTGSDIAELTHKMISEFTSLANDLDAIKTL